MAIKMKSYHETFSVSWSKIFCFCLLIFLFSSKSVSSRLWRNFSINKKKKAILTIKVMDCIKNHYHSTVMKLHTTAAKTSPVTATKISELPFLPYAIPSFLIQPSYDLSLTGEESHFECYLRHLFLVHFVQL